jgi:hypothetical protein
VFNFRLLYTYNDRIRIATSSLGPVVLAEHAKRLSDGFVETLRRDVDSVFDATRVAAADPAGSKRQTNLLVFSCFVRYDIRGAIGVLTHIRSPHSAGK